MKIYEKFSTEENSKQPIVILHPFNVIVDDIKKANSYIRSRTGKKIREEKILKCCDGLIDIADTYKDKNTGKKIECIFRYATEQETKEFNEIKQNFIKRSKENKNYYVYRWYYINTGITFYVGKGTNGRYKDISSYRRNFYFNNVVNMQKDNVVSEKIHEKLTEKEALELENKTISELLNDGYTLISSTPYYEYNSNIDFDTSNEKILMNILNGGEHEQQGRVVGKKSRKNLSESQKKYANSKEGKKKSSDAQSIAQKRPETIQKRKNSLKKYYENEESIIKSSNAAKIYQQDPSKMNRNRKPVHCIELNKTFIRASDITVYFDKYFDVHVKGYGIASKIQDAIRSNNGIAASGIINNGDKYGKQLHWRFATKQEIEFEKAKKIIDYELDKKIGILEATIEEEIQYEMLLDIVEELGLFDFLYKKDEQYILPIDCNEILNDLDIKIEKNKIEKYVLEKEEIENNKPDCSKKASEFQNSYNQKFNKSNVLKCVSSSGVEHIFGNFDDAKEYLLKFNDKVLQGVSMIRNVKKKKNWQYLKDDTGRLTWSIVDKDSEEYRNFIKSYDDAYKIYINNVLAYIEEEENNELINKLNKIKELYIEK